MFNKPDTAQQIADRVSKATSPADFHKLVLACEARRQAIRARENEIGGTPGFEAPARKAALNKGPDALAALDEELKRLEFELEYLDRLERLIHSGAEEARIAEIRKDMPAAQRRLNSELKAARAAVEAVIEKIAALQSTFHVLGSYIDAGLPFPLDDTEVQALLELREAIWTLPNPPLMLTPLVSDARKQIAKFPLAYIWRDDKEEFVYSIRQRLPPPAPGQQTL